MTATKRNSTYMNEVHKIIKRGQNYFFQQKKIYFASFTEYPKTIFITK